MCKIKNRLSGAVSFLWSFTIHPFLNSTPDRFFTFLFGDEVCFGDFCWSDAAVFDAVSWAFEGDGDFETADSDGGVVGDVLDVEVFFDAEGEVAGGVEF